MAKVTVDNANYQIDVKFIQLFTPTISVDAERQYPYILYTPAAFVKKTEENLSHTTHRSKADKFIFIEKTYGQYYIYDQTANCYIYYTIAQNGGNAKTTTNSHVRYTAHADEANTWQLLCLSDETIAIIPGSVADPSTSSPAWNFTGGIEDGSMLNLWTASDANSAWEIIDPAAASMPCASLMYALPGAQYLHKLTTHEGETVSSVDFGSISTLSLKEDRIETGNKYKYVAGVAPKAEGEYAYTVNLVGADGEKKQAKIRLVVSSHLQSATPMMGWLTWNWFARAISHDKMVEIAKGMERYGLIDAGFNTIVLDDAWAKQESDKAKLTYDPIKFPEGISGLKTALKAINCKLKIGIYSDAGSMTCENYQPGSYGFESQHLALFDSWGVDMLSWRSTSDAREDWIGNPSRPGVIGGVDETRRLWMYAGVNHFNDLDMMCIGLHGLGGPSNNTAEHQTNGGKITGLTDAQARTQMSLWSMLASPLALTCDLREAPKGEANSDQSMPHPLITEADVQTLTNQEILAISQDALGQQAEYMEALSTGTTDYSPSGYDVFVKDLTDSRIAVSITNRATSAASVPAIPLTAIYLKANTRYICREIWSQTEGEIENTLSVGSLNPCETRVYVLSKKK